ncbi:hypothetical protein V3C99_010061 [Haemonchus contortus]|uniref:C-type lectin domain-containing protein n=1 Tax=Haemonchus contortus TaxID=6289 RepID=A0A7I4YIW4_HAECO
MELYRAGNIESMVAIVGMRTATLLALVIGVANCITKGWVNKYGFSYKVFDRRATFDEAEAACVAEGGHLASIHSQEEDEFIYNISNPHADQKTQSDLLWIGLRQKNWPKDKKWTWTDGTAVNFINWSRGEPNNLYNAEHCVELYTAPIKKHPHTKLKKWNDYRCNTKQSQFVCKKVNLVCIE